MKSRSNNLNSTDILYCHATACPSLPQFSILLQKETRYSGGGGKKVDKKMIFFLFFLLLKKENRYLGGGGKKVDEHMIYVLIFFTTFSL